MGTEAAAILVVPVTPDGHQWLNFHPSRSGWAIFRSAATSVAYDGQQSFLFVRIGALDAPAGVPQIIDGRPAVVSRPIVASEVGAFVIREARVAFKAGVGPRVMRDLPLALIEAAINQPHQRDAIASHLPPGNAVIVPFPEERGRPDWYFAGPPTRRTRPRLKMRVPEGRPKPDEFYAQVAERFAYLTTTSTRPAAELADANDVPVGTVHGWVKEARRRGFLPPGERSRRKAPLA